MNLNNINLIKKDQSTKIWLLWEISYYSQDMCQHKHSSNFKGDFASSMNIRCGPSTLVGHAMRTERRMLSNSLYALFGRPSNKFFVVSDSHKEDTDKFQSPK